MSVKSVVIYHPIKEPITRDDIVRMQQQIVQAINELLARMTAIENRVTSIETRIAAHGIP